MAKKNFRQSAFSESDYIRHRVRSLPVGKCFMAPGWKETGETVAIVTRCHPKGTITAGLYLVDTFCLGVKEPFYRFSIDDYDLENQVIWMSDLTKTNVIEALNNFARKVETEEYTYTPAPDSYPVELDTVHKRLYKLLSDSKYESGFPDNILKKILGIPHDELRRGLEQILLFQIGRTLSEIESDKDEYSAVATHCIMLLGEVGDKNSLAVLLEVLRQNDDFFEYNFGDAPSEIFIPTLYLLGQDNPDVFNDYLQEPGLFDYARSYVLSAVAMIADRQSSRRDEIIGWFRKLLHFYIKNLPEKRCCDGVLVSLFVSDLVDIKAVELLPEIKLLFDTGYVEKSMCGDFEAVKKDMSEVRRQTEISSYLLDLSERYRHYARWYR